MSFAHLVCQVKVNILKYFYTLILIVPTPCWEKNSREVVWIKKQNRRRRWTRCWLHYTSHFSYAFLLLSLLMLLYFGYDWFFLCYSCKHSYLMFFNILQFMLNITHEFSCILFQRVHFSLSFCLINSYVYCLFWLSWWLHLPFFFYF